MEDKIEITIKDMCQVIKRRIWLIVIVTIAVTLSFVMYSKNIKTPVYQSKVSILVGRQNNEKLTDKEVQLYDMVYKTCYELATTNSVAQTAADKLGNGTLPDDLLAKTTVTPKAGTMVMDISVKDNSAEAAYKEVQAYSEAFIEKAENLKIASGDIEIVDKAQLPKDSIQASIKHDLIRGFLLGLLLSGLLAFILEFKHGSLKTKENK